MRSIVERLSSIAAISIVASSLFYADPTRACAPAPPPGVEVRVADEAALIVWDDITQTEHFIRRASFQTAGQSFGFIVPTPTVPELGEANNNIFDRLANQVRPDRGISTATRGVQIVPISCCASYRSGASSGAPGVPEVRVLHAQIVRWVRRSGARSRQPGCACEVAHRSRVRQHASASRVAHVVRSRALEAHRVQDRE